jgi:hypothetical protein
METIANPVARPSDETITFRTFTDTRTLVSSAYLLSATQKCGIVVVCGLPNTLFTLHSPADCMYQPFIILCLISYKQTNKLHGLSPRANYTDRATAV